MLKAPKILIIDDITDNLKTIISLFDKSEIKYNLFQAISGQDALSVIENTDLDLIITDWDMPKMNGIELIKMIKAKPEKREIPIIIATGVMLTPEDLQTALNAGALDYIRKPFEQVEFFARIKSILKISEYNKQIIEQKNKELAENTLFLIKNNRFNSMIIEELNKLKSPNSEQTEIINNITKEINSKVKTDSWRRFNLAFETVNTNFTKDLLQKHPSLSDSEIKLIILIKLGMKTKEISDVLYKTSDSLKVARYRIRQKLELQSNQNLYSYLNSL